MISTQAQHDFARPFLYGLAVTHVSWLVAQWTANTVYFYSISSAELCPSAQRPLTGVWVKDATVTSS